MNDLKKIRFVFVCPNPDYVMAMKHYFGRESNWAFHTGVFETATGCDTLVTAGNSYGIMDGGLDLAVRDYFGLEQQVRVQNAIRDQYCGVLPVGCAVSVPTRSPIFKELLYVPTMRLPMDIRETNFVFYAALATFRTLVQSKRKPKGVAIPAFGALTGRMEAREMAKQFIAGWIQATTRYQFRTWPAVEHLENSINYEGY